MFIGVFLFILLLTAAFSFKRTIYGCQFLLFTRILIPECVRLTPIAEVSLNTGVIAVLILACIRDIVLNETQRRTFLRDTYIKVAVGFVFCWLIITLLSDYKDMEYQSNNLRQMVVTEICPLIIFCIAIKDKADLELTLKVLFVCTFINCVYGIFTVAIGSNPYTFAINSEYSNREYLLDSALLGDGRGITGTSSTFEHANGWGYFLPIAFALFFFYNKIRPSKKNVVLLLLISICVVFSSKRSALVAYMAFWAFYFIYAKGNQKGKFIVWGIVGVIVLYVIVSIIPSLEKAKGLIESSLFFWDDSLSVKNDIGGSTMSMRIDQITYPFHEIRDNLLFGHGFGWTSYYLSRNAFHPIMYGFENLASEALCNGGLCGLGLWLWFFWKSYKYSSLYDKEKMYYALFSIVQFTIAMATGLSYLVFYGIFIVLLNKFYLLRNEENISCNGSLQ